MSLDLLRDLGLGVVTTVVSLMNSSVTRDVDLEADRAVTSGGRLLSTTAVLRRSWGLKGTGTA